MLHETVDLETETGCVYMVHDDPEVVKREFEQLMYIEENYPKLLQSDEPLFAAPEDKTQITPEIENVLAEDTEVLISHIMAWYKNGAQGESPVPEALLDAAPYNRRIMELIRGLC